MAVAVHAAKFFFTCTGENDMAGRNRKHHARRGARDLVGMATLRGEPGTEALRRVLAPPDSPPCCGCRCVDDCARVCGGDGDERRKVPATGAVCGRAVSSSGRVAGMRSTCSVAACVGHAASEVEALHA